MVSASFDPSDRSSRPISTELSVEAEEFDEYNVSGRPTISFALKEFKV